MTCASCANKSPEAAQIRRARAILCHFCPYVEHTSDGPWTGVGVACTVSGKPVDHHIQSCHPTCPVGKHPDPAGLVRFAWIRWYGVPRFLRWALAYRLTGAVPGCGCIYRLKNLWLRLRTGTM